MNPSEAERTDPLLSCNPQELIFDLPMFGETVFRLQCPRRREPRLLIARDGADWESHSMVLEREGRWYVALKLPRGQYLYYFVVEGAPVMDPTNPSSLSVVGGIPVNRLDVPDGTKTLTITNESRVRQELVLGVKPRFITFHPDRFSLGPSQSIAVRATPRLGELLPGVSMCRVLLSDAADGTILADLPSRIAVNTSVPRLEALKTMTVSGDLMHLAIKVTGKGTVRCHIIDRITPNIDYVEMFSPDQSGMTGKTYQPAGCSVSLRRALSGVPALTLFSDSPFPEERRLEFFL